MLYNAVSKVVIYFCLLNHKGNEIVTDFRVPRLILGDEILSAALKVDVTLRS